VEIRKAGYGAIWHGQKSWNGVAILARGAMPVERRRALPGDPTIAIAAISKPSSPTS
jgi:exodeoxyribonuclease III